MCSPLESFLGVFFLFFWVIVLSDVIIAISVYVAFFRKGGLTIFTAESTDENIDI